MSSEEMDKNEFKARYLDGYWGDLHHYKLEVALAGSEISIDLANDLLYFDLKKPEEFKQLKRLAKILNDVIEWEESYGSDDVGLNHGIVTTEEYILLLDTANFFKGSFEKHGMDFVWPSFGKREGKLSLLWENVSGKPDVVCVPQKDEVTVNMWYPVNQEETFRYDQIVSREICDYIAGV